MARRILDLNLLRTLVMGVRAGSFASAIDQIGRSQSAVSIQMRKLEAALETQLFVKKGRTLGLTPAGETLYGYAERILALHDEAVDAVGQEELAGRVRFGMSVDFENTCLSDVLARFLRASPGVSLDLVIERNPTLMSLVERRQLDLALFLAADATRKDEQICSTRMVWLGHQEFRWDKSEPLPLLVLERSCFFRDAAVSVLDGAGIKWRIAATSPAQSGLWAAAQAGLGVTVRTEMSQAPRLEALGSTLKLPQLPTADVCLRVGQGKDSSIVRRLREVVLEELLRY